MVDLCQRICRELHHWLPDTLVVSGLAYGVDYETHRAALAAGLPTVGVVAHGLDRIYPAAHRPTAVEMVRHGGGIVTEYLTQTEPMKGNFVRRNRIVAGLTEATIVVESAKQGGSLITAGLAVDYGRRLLACPGRLGDVASEGCNRLVAKGMAIPFTSVEDLLEQLHWVSTQTGEQSLFGPEEMPSVNTAALPPDERRLLDLLATTDGLQAHDIPARAGLSTFRVTTLLFKLEMMGLIEALPGGAYRKHTFS